MSKDMVDQFEWALILFYSTAYLWSAVSKLDFGRQCVQWRQSEFSLHYHKGVNGPVHGGSMPISLWTVWTDCSTTTHEQAMFHAQTNHKFS